MHVNKKIYNAFYAQSGGVTAVINSSACGLITAARDNPDKIGKVYAGKNGILGAINNDLIDTSVYTDEQIKNLRSTPGGAFGSCRVKLPDFKIDSSKYKKILDVFKQHEIRYFFYNGGGDSQDTTNKLAQYAKIVGYPLQCIGIPKTIDNDLPCTDFSPGFPSTAKYIAISTMESGLDIISMAQTSTKVFILEVMGRNAGWIAASSGLASGCSNKSRPPHLILFPEIVFDIDNFTNKVKSCVSEYGYCYIVASEGIKNIKGEFVSAQTQTLDSFGHTQLGGVACVLAKHIKDKLGYKNHWAVVDYLQRASAHIASSVDVKLSFELGRCAIEKALSGESGIMLTLNRVSFYNKNIKNNIWQIGQVGLDKVSNVEKKLPRNFIDKSGYEITDACYEYLSALIQGESFPEYSNGLPQYQHFLEEINKLSVVSEG